MFKRWCSIKEIEVCLLCEILIASFLIIVTVFIIVTKPVPNIEYS